MKPKTIIAIIAIVTAITYISCNWFDKPTAADTNSIIGKWQLVNFADSSKDSSKNDIGLFLVSMSMKDSLYFQFKEDSTALIFTSKEKMDSGRYDYDQINRSLIVYGKQEDSTVATVRFVNNDSMNLYAPKDSITYILKKVN